MLPFFKKRKGHIILFGHVLHIQFYVNMNLHEFIEIIKMWFSPDHLKWEDNLPQVT